MYLRILLFIIYITYITYNILSYVYSYIKFVNNEESNIRKMYFNVNAEWYDCKYYYRNNICNKCEEGSEFAVYLFEHNGNNRYGDLAVYCKKGHNLTKSINLN
jgi:hypothetical protein